MSFRAQFASLILFLGFAIPARGDYYYPRYFPYQQQQNSVISIDMDPKDQLNSSYRVAAREGRISDMLRFVREGASVDSASDEGQTALMYAARNCSTQVVSELVRLHVNINLRDHDGNTALTYAVVESCLPVVKLLLKQPDLEVRFVDRSRRGILEYAEESATTDVGGPASEILRLLKRKVAYRTRTR